MSKFAILLGGGLSVTARLRAQIAGARVIAADSGMMHAASLRLVPELWVGDFDSAGSELALRYADIPRETFPAEKDATDGAIAVAAALRRGADAFVLVGGLGGQADHVLGHFGLALHLARQGHKTILTSGDEEAHPVLPGETAIDLGAGDRLSIVAFADLEGLDLDGVKWPLRKRAVPLGSTLTMSNVATGPVHIGLAAGYGMAIAYPGRDAHD
jgi:thiamine pyrophosphokinase